MKNKKYIYTLMAMLLLSIFSAVMKPDFLSLSNAITILRQSAILLILSLGLTGVVLTGNIDLSVGGVAALSGCICGKMLNAQYPIALAIVLAVVVGLFVGCCNGCLVGSLDLPSFVVTYGVNMVVFGITLLIMNGSVIYDLPKPFTRLGTGTIGKVPILVLIALFIFFLSLILYDHTVFGRHLYMIGLNRQAAKYSGISCFKTLLYSYILCGLTGAFGGILLTARLNTADAGMGETYGLQIVAAVVLGGTSLLGGEGNVMGTVVGSIFLTMVLNIMNMNGINSNWHNMVMGTIILAMVVLNNKKKGCHKNNL